MNKISVIIPVYNSQEFLDACLSSVLQQTYQNFEIILVDDGSTDGSAALCDQWVERDSRIHTIHQKNQGVSAARNRGLVAATGDLVSFIDSDDRLEEDMYEFLVKLVQDYGADIAHCGYKRMSETGAVLKQVSGTHIVLCQRPEEAISCMLEGRYFVGGLWNKLYTYRSIKNLKFCTELKNNEDILFNAMAFQNAQKIVFADETKYLYYEHSSSACNQMREERQMRDSAQAAQLLVKYCKSESLRVIAEKWAFDTKCDLYRFLTIHGEGSKQERMALRGWLLEKYPSLQRMVLKREINYYLLMYLPQIYRIIYGIYNIIRSPNWDVK